MARCCQSLRTAYLFNLIGTTYGGDGQTTFALPDLRGRTIIGASGNDPIGTEVGQETVSREQPGAGRPKRSCSAVQQHGAVARADLHHRVAGNLPVTGWPAAASTSKPYLGEIDTFAGNFAPSGWALADGQLLPINQNQALFSLLGTQYGGNGTTNFALPNLEDRTIVGAGGGLTVGTAFGSNSVTVTSADLPTTGYVVSSGQTSSFLTLYIGDTLTVLSGGVASGASLNPGASGTVSAGGIARGDLVNGGSQTVYGTGSTLRSSRAAPRWCRPAVSPAAQLSSQAPSRPCPSVAWRSPPVS